MTRPLLLDLFCGAGGCAAGYHRAGFAVVGVDNKPQPNYPYIFVQDDALAFLRRNGKNFAAIHASPPCQRFSAATGCRPGVAETHPDLVTPTRALLIASGKPYVIENVVGAPLIDPVTLCGVMFPELRVYRHRLFESNVPLAQPSHRPHDDNCHGNHMISRKGYVNVFGGGGNTEYKRKAMGIDWMTRDELSQSIPPVYTEFVGRQVLAALVAALAA